MSELLCNIDGIVSAFNKHTKEDGDCTTLSKGELKHLIQKEFAEVIVDPHDPKTIEMVLQHLDQDRNGKVDLEEFTLLVFRVARACYRKTQQHKAGPADGQSSKAEQHTTCKDKEAPKEESTCRSTRELEKISGDGESQRSSKEQKQEIPKSERCTDGKLKEFLVRGDASSQLPGKPLVACPTQKESSENQMLKENPTRQTTCVEEKAEEEPQSAAEEASSQSMRSKQPKYFTPEQDTRGIQRGITQPSSQPCQMLMQGHADQQEEKSQRTEQKQTTQQSTQEAERTPKQRETDKTQGREQDVTCGKPQKSQEATQTPTHRCVQKSQASEERSTFQPIQQPQAEQDRQLERPPMSEVSSTHQPQTGEQPTDQLEPKPWTQEHVPKCKAEEELQEEPVHESSQQRKKTQGQEQAQTGQRNCGSLTTGCLTGQLGCQPQGSEKTSVGPHSQAPKQASTIHERCQASASEQQKPSPKEQKPQNPIGLGHSQHHECWSQTAEEHLSPQEKAKPQIPKRDSNCDLKETPVVQSPRGSSAKLPFKISQLSKPLQFPSPWSPKQ